MTPTFFKGDTHEAALALNKLGWNDLRIASAFSAGIQTVRRWRKKHDIPAVDRENAPKLDDAVAFKMYYDGATDGEIARHFDAAQPSVTRWRQRHGLVPNFDQNGPLSVAQIRKARKLLRQGWTRLQVAREIGAGTTAVARIRKKMSNEPGLRGTGKTLSGARAITSRDPRALYARIVKAVGKGVAPDIAADSISDMYLDLMEGKLSPEAIEDAARRYKGRVLDRYASRFGPRSLDEEIGEDFFLADLVEDASAFEAFDHVLEHIDYQRGFSA